MSTVLKKNVSCAKKVLRSEMKTMDQVHKKMWESKLKEIGCVNYRELKLDEQLSMWNEYCPYYETYLNL